MQAKEHGEERWAVLNINSRELLSDWVTTLAEAHAIADDVEQHESQPEVDVISLSWWNERVRNSTNPN